MKTMKVVCVFDPDGNAWSTPKGKSSWASVSAAKNAWACHTWLDNGPNRYNLKLRSTRQGKWSKDAEPLGWTVEVVQEFDLVPKGKDYG